MTRNHGTFVHTDAPPRPGVTSQNRTNHRANFTQPTPHQHLTTQSDPLARLAHDSLPASTSSWSTTQLQPTTAMNTYHPLRELGIPSRLLTIADALLRDNHGENRNWTPSVNIFEDESGYHVSAELPDVTPSDVKVTVRDGVLTLKGERKLEKKSDTTRYHLVERSYGQFSRSFTLPKDSDGDRVAAEFKNGVLTVSVPKRIEIQPREIEVKVN